MADFVAVLKKTLDGLGETTPEVRAKVYDKARATIAAKLAAINPPPPAAVAERQKRALEDAIASIERGYAKPAAADPLAELENIFSSIDRNRTQPNHVRSPAPSQPAPAPAQPKASPPPPPAPPRTAPPPSWQGQPQPAPTKAPAPKPAPFVPAAEQDEDDDLSETGTQEQAGNDFRRIEPRRRRGGAGGLIAAIVVLLIVAGGGYGIWLNKDAFADLIGMGGSTQTAKTETPKPAQTATDQAKPAEPAAAEKPAAETAAAPAQPATPAAEPNEPAKFTQRLTPDGKEVDAGPSGGVSGIGEGTSVAALTTPPPATPPATTEPPAAAAPSTDGAAATTAEATPPSADGAAATAPAAAPGETAAPAGETALPVGQKAIFYEERTSAAQGSAEPGNIVWSLVQESPGGDAPPEPAIRAEATIPGKDVQLRMTIRRNADQTLPASHIIEMIFLTPDGFDGGGIDNVLRIAMKSSEQDAGRPLIGIPAKIADGFFLVALNETKADQDTNLALLRGQDWIDVPMVYKSGRRALLTMEKGIPGEKVFDEAIKAWQAKSSG